MAKLCLLAIFALAIAAAAATAPAGDTVKHMNKPVSAAPAFPQFAIVTRGEVVCTGQCTYCAGASRANIVARYAYDDDGWLTQYREDSVFTSIMPVYNREIWLGDVQYELMLYDGNSTSLQCFQRALKPTNMSRFFAQVRGLNALA